MDANRQWFKSACGMPVAETCAEISFCGHAIMQDEPLIIPDTLSDARFFDNPLVTRDPKFRFYAGCPLQTFAGHKVATFCIGDTDPRTFPEEQVKVLKSLAAMAEDQFNLIDTIDLQAKLVEAKELESTNEFIRKAPWDATPPKRRPRAS